MVQEWSAESTQTTAPSSMSRILMSGWSEIPEEAVKLLQPLKSAPHPILREALSPETSGPSSV